MQDDRGKHGQPEKIISIFIHLLSWQEMGAYDIPAMIDKIKEVTGQEKMFYVGHSMGTTGLMAMANQKPEYQETIILANFLAPIAYVDHMTSPIHYLAPFVDSVAVSILI